MFSKGKLCHKPDCSLPNVYVNSEIETSDAGKPSNDFNDKDEDKKDSGPNAGAIAGGVVGGVAGLSLIAAAIWFFLRRRRQRQQENIMVLEDSNHFGAMGLTSPKTHSYAPSYSQARSHSPVEVEGADMNQNGELDSMPRYELDGGDIPTTSDTLRTNA